MMSRALLALLAGALLGACELASAPPPSILAVEPTEVMTGEPVELRLHIDALMPGTMDYGNRSVSGDPLSSVVRVWVGERQVEVVGHEPGGLLVVRVPADLAEGTHDVRLVLSDGREALRAQGLVVTSVFDSDLFTQQPDAPVERADGGTSPTDAGLVGERDGLSGFRIEPVEEQVREVPFVLELHAQGSGARSFQGSVTLSVDQGSIEPAVVGPFEDGLLRVKVKLDQPGAKRVITAVDKHGNAGRTNEFRVRPN